MRVLVTGGAGYIGSVIAERLVDLVPRVVVLDNLTQGHRAAVSAEAVFVAGDISRGSCPRRGDHSIARGHGRHSHGCRGRDRAVGEGTGSPLQRERGEGRRSPDAMLACGVRRVVCSSSAAVYGEPLETPVTEEHAQDPVRLHGESKHAFERVLHWYYEAHGLTYIALRYFSAAGASTTFGEDHDPESHLVPLVLETALGRRDHVDVLGTDYDTADGTCVRDFVHVITSWPSRRSRECRAAPTTSRSGEGCSVLEVIECARRLTGRPIPTVNAPGRPGRAGGELHAGEKRPGLAVQAPGSRGDRAVRVGLAPSSLRRLRLLGLGFFSEHGAKGVRDGRQ